jgi:hypothetical protein
METLLEPWFVTAKSRFPSPLKSPTATAEGFKLVGKLAAGEKVTRPAAVETSAKRKPMKNASPTRRANRQIQAFLPGLGKGEIERDSKNWVDFSILGVDHLRSTANDWTANCKTTVRRIYERGGGNGSVAGNL